MASFKQLKLIDEQELNRLIEKQIRQYDPALKILASVRKEMNTLMERNDLLPEEKLALYQSAQQRFDSIKPSVGISSSINPHPHGSILPGAALGAAGIRPMEIKAEHDGQSESVALKDDLDLGQKQTSFSGSDVPQMEKHALRQLALKTAPTEHGVLDVPAIEVDAKHQAKLIELTKLMNANPSIIGLKPSTGEMVVKGETIKGSSYPNLIRSLYHDSVKHNLTGQPKFIAALSELFQSSPTISPQNVMYKKDYLSHFMPASKASSITSSYASNASSTTSSSASSTAPQTGKGLLSSLGSPPGKKLRVLKCY